ncbi:hypothetical protein GTP41_05760 [Pseudoduganella sp. DS3]|uniref:DUF5610 domain-containing protein n=1 Tax=Pseudoduganella guangdongensis TaxID=2692179 RepID=A0A6N9HDV2_9BURK|nr:hypothetical protein [Pseudoduganella guangdongensis]
MSNSISVSTRATPATASSDTAISASTRAKLQLNVSILQESASISLNSENDPLALVYKSAITSINEQLQADFGPDAIQNATSQDNSPEGTAGRIVSLSTAFFSAFQKQNSDLEGDQALNKFMDTIKGGIEKGFKEARDILQGLQVLNGDIASNIDKTYALVMKGLDDFVANQGGPKDDA